MGDPRTSVDVVERGKFPAYAGNLTTVVEHEVSYFTDCSVAAELSKVWLVINSLRHELPSLARTPGSWVRIPLKAWLSVCVFSVFMLFCV
jgi:hypothetical protein